MRVDASRTMAMDVDVDVQRCVRGATDTHLPLSLSLRWYPSWRCHIKVRVRAAAVDGPIGHEFEFSFRFQFLFLFWFWFFKNAHKMCIPVRSRRLLLFPLSSSSPPSPYCSYY